MNAEEGLPRRYAVCNELFGDAGISRSFATIAGAGFPGVEIAPHTIWGDFSGNLSRRTGEVRRALAEEGLAFVGFHWLLVGPPDLHATTVDRRVRQTAWDHLARLVDLAGELGGGVLVFGSPHQRGTREGTSHATALRNLADGLAAIADRAAAAKCTVLLEAVSRPHTDVINTLAEANEVLSQLSREGLGMIFDFHNVDDEDESWEQLIRRYQKELVHVHLNEIDGSVPSSRSARLDEFLRAFSALRAGGYDRWISLEIFNVPDDPAAVLRGVGDFLSLVDP
jgi:D-psicose/D-tagatose/L-ribulose 3-epimerase